MDLKQYIEESDVLYKDWAVKLDISPQYLWSVVHKKRMPSKFLAHRIEIETKGKVSMQDLFGRPVLEKEKPKRCPCCKRRYLKRKQSSVKGLDEVF